ncbi:MAG: hypothetical protein LJF04_00830 [Gemmatimonadetes bacterium]|nr:hypothetical protein [Gemmatimonadota bacterium]
MTAQTDAAPAPSTWLPEWLEGLYSPLATHPLVLATLVVVVGPATAIAARWLILLAGRRITRRTQTELDDQLLRLAAWVVALIIGYLGVVGAAETLPLPAAGGGSGVGVPPAARPRPRQPRIP